jgi:putative chitinase
VLGNWVLLALLALAGGVVVLREKLLLLEQLRAIMPRLPLETAVLALPALVTAMREARIDTPPRVAAFLAQLAHESGELRWLVELPHNRAVPSCRLCQAGRVPHRAGEQYEGRGDLGNTQPGDGERYLGRGWIQLTGRANYREAGRALGLPLEEQPELAAQVGVSARVAAWYWRTRGLNALADVGDFSTITRRINGGLNGQEHRERYYAVALQVLATPPPTKASA